VDLQLEIIDMNLLESLNQANKMTKICDLNQSLAAEVIDLKATKPSQDCLSNKVAAAHWEIEELEKDVWIEKRHCTKL